VQVGDLVKVISDSLRVDIGTIALVTEIQPHTDSLGTVFYCYAHMVESGYRYKFRIEHLEVINASR
jgi:hypothetical protein